MLRYIECRPFSPRAYQLGRRLNNGVGALAIDPARSGMGHDNHAPNHRYESPYGPNNPCHKPGPARGSSCGALELSGGGAPPRFREGLPLSSAVENDMLGAGEDTRTGKPESHLARRDSAGPDDER
jgi:hypothetical protein